MPLLFLHVVSAKYPPLPHTIGHVGRRTWKSSVHPAVMMRLGRCRQRRLRVLRFMRCVMARNRVLPPSPIFVEEIPPSLSSSSSHVRQLLDFSSVRLADSNSTQLRALTLAYRCASCNFRLYIVTSDVLATQRRR